MERYKTIHVCTECFLVLTVGYTSLIGNKEMRDNFADGHARKIAAKWGSEWDGLVEFDDHVPLRYSKQECEGCGNTESGYRFSAAVYEAMGERK